LRDSIFFRQAELILRILPLIHPEEVFALKGGTAINYFVRDMPRLSVDIDLVYLPVTSREEALTTISRSLERIAKRIQKMFSNVVISESKINSRFIIKLILRQNDATVKIEPNQILRGSVYPAETRELVQEAQNAFELSTSMRTLSTEELYGGKICAALDRQHPRDFFDIKMLFEHEGFIERIRKAFIVYLISHRRPMLELLNPRFSDMRHVFDDEFQEMVRVNIEYEELIKTREYLVKLIRSSLTGEEIQFIISVQNDSPDWDLLELDGIENLPAVKWKLLNVGKMNSVKKKQAVAQLRDYFEL
jgi:predicted nucleotidyltransferase component of viral defense system